MFLNIAFVGVKRKYQDLSPDYRWWFTKYHLELPVYYSGLNKVTVTTVDYSEQMNSCMRAVKESEFIGSRDNYDVVVHWRKWFPELYRPEAINVIVCQDHSFSQEWISGVQSAFDSGKLYGILCFPGWHRENLFRELGEKFPKDRLIAGLTLGVDTETYYPAYNKDPRMLLWSSDPGRGLAGACELAVKLYQRDHKFRLHVCQPDYSAPVSINHPAIICHGFLKNGQALFDKFRTAGVLPYTSTFMEPSSRAHRQAQAAGCLVLYPPDRGTPSELILDGRTGFVRPTDQWEKLILEYADGQHRDIGENARLFAHSENWGVQRDRFTNYFEKLLRKNND